MHKKLLNLAAVLTSLVGYLEWGQGQAMFLFQVEAEILARALVDPAAVIHPLTVLPMLGQMALLVTLVQKEPAKGLTYVGIAGVGILLAFMFVIGLIAPNLKVLSSTVPFLAVAAMTVRQHWRRGPAFTRTPG